MKLPAADVLLAWLGRQVPWRAAASGSALRSLPPDSTVRWLARGAGTVRNPVPWPVPKREGLAWHGTAVPACGAGTAQHCAAQHPGLQEHSSGPPASLFTYSPRAPALCSPIAQGAPALCSPTRCAHSLPSMPIPGQYILLCMQTKPCNPHKGVPLSALHPLPLTAEALHSLPLMCYLKCISHNLHPVWDVISS